MSGRLRNLDVALVRTFVVVAESASMTVAANILNLTQGAISQQIKRLEEGFDCVLFERERRGLRLTAGGERLVGRARRLLQLNDEIWDEMAITGMAGRVRFGVPYDLVGTSLAPILKAYADAYPAVEITLACATSPQLTQALADGSIDLAVIEEPAGPSAGECLGVERLVWAGARGGTAYRKRPLPVSLVADTCAFRPKVIEALSEAGLTWRAVFENGNIEATGAMVRTDLAVTAWLAFTVPPDLDILPAGAGLPELPSFAVNLHLPRRDIGPAAREFARFVRDGLLRQRVAA